MKSKLENLQSIVLTKISVAAQSGNVDLVSRLSPKIIKIREIITAYERIENEFNKLRIELESEPAKQSEVSRDLGKSIYKSRESRNVIEITIDWTTNGQPYGKETFFERKASQTMVKLIDRLYEVIGQRVLEEGAKMRISRGPLLSRDPESCFLNQLTGKTYSHQVINGTGYYVLTHSTTKEKVENITNFLYQLNFTPGSFEIHEVSK